MDFDFAGNGVRVLGDDDLPCKQPGTRDFDQSRLAQADAHGPVTALSPSTRTMVPLAPPTVSATTPPSGTARQPAWTSQTMLTCRNCPGPRKAAACRERDAHRQRVGRAVDLAAGIGRWSPAAASPRIAPAARL